MVRANHSINVTKLKWLQELQYLKSVHCCHHGDHDTVLVALTMKLPPTMMSA